LTRLAPFTFLEDNSTWTPTDQTTAAIAEWEELAFAPFLKLSNQLKTGFLGMDDELIYKDSQDCEGKTVSVRLSRSDTI
jgi:hypothetical protein